MFQFEFVLSLMSLSERSNTCRHVSSELEEKYWHCEDHLSCIYSKTSTILSVHIHLDLMYFPLTVSSLTCPAGSLCSLKSAHSICTHTLFSTHTFPKEGQWHIRQLLFSSHDRRLYIRNKKKWPQFHRSDSCKDVHVQERCVWVSVCVSLCVWLCGEKGDCPSTQKATVCLSAHILHVGNISMTAFISKC